MLNCGWDVGDTGLWNRWAEPWTRHPAHIKEHTASSLLTAVEFLSESKRDTNDKTEVFVGRHEGLVNITSEVLKLEVGYE